MKKAQSEHLKRLKYGCCDSHLLSAKLPPGASNSSVVEPPGACHSSAAGTRRHDAFSLIGVSYYVCNISIWVVSNHVGGAIYRLGLNVMQVVTR